jgi:hypothetical protein
VVIEPTVIVELWEQLLDRERELDEQENALLAPSALSGGCVWSVILLMTGLESSGRTIVPNCVLLPSVGGAL